MSTASTEDTEPQVNSEDVVSRVGEAIRNHLAQATEAERQRCIAQIEAWCSERERDRREEHMSRVARGVPAPSTYTPLYLGAPPCAESGLDTAAADTHTDSRSDCAMQGYETPPRSTKPAHHYPLSGDAKQKRSPRNKRNTVRPPLWPRLTQNMACLIAWISGSNRQSLTWELDIE